MRICVLACMQSDKAPERGPLWCPCGRCGLVYLLSLDGLSHVSSEQNKHFLTSRT